ncbi:gfo/Idh/MocA family oxidoreductase [Staphylococcus agnetis]|uniref:Gfo/Idh/MocA family protein n=1 Tax=Staphylococcus agnetis TaxID=985762 RepID=UPI001431B6A0|nr:Gfo/Idh/MocA family oxidoreductase [Staphylococcus agnetis]NJH86280.1 gfo/Idh/MocA family oxidoreductase [Staphylococcus agnetis]NJI15968.1 gfo/Idh/MocA family oxidoreductase [Staphylococcus agnetis]
MKKLNVGVIGAGNISIRHLNAYASNDSVNILAICDIDLNRAKQQADNYNIPYIFSNYEDLLKIKDLDAVSICVWNSLHKEVALAALSANKHIFLEKPPALNYEETKELSIAHQSKNVILHVGFVLRHSEHIELSKQIIESGKLGEIYYAKASWLRRAGSPKGWFTKKSLSGGGPLIDLGIHMIDICWYLMGKPRIISSQGHTNNTLGPRDNVNVSNTYLSIDKKSYQYDVEDFANALLTLENGASIYIDVSHNLHMEVNEKIEVTLYGEKGSLKISPNLIIDTELLNKFCTLKIETTSSYIDFDMSHKKEVDFFVKSCLNNSETNSSIVDALSIMEVISNIYK